jgi:hypothetical protein
MVVYVGGNEGTSDELVALLNPYVGGGGMYFLKMALVIILRISLWVLYLASVIAREYINYRLRQIYDMIYFSALLLFISWSIRLVVIAAEVFIIARNIK